MTSASTPTIVTSYPTDDLAVVSVHLSDGSFARVEVYRPRVKFGQPHPAEVNWSAIGSVPAVDALAYAEALRVAAELAATLEPAS